MDQEGVPQAAPALQDQIDALVEAVNDDDLLELLSALRSLHSEQLNLTHSSTGFSPLSSAVLEQHQLRKLIVHLLLAKGASYTAGEQSAIELARQCGNAKMFELLRKWERGEREGELEELARYLLTLTDEEAAIWREQTIADEQQRADTLEDLRSSPLHVIEPPSPVISNDPSEPLRSPAQVDERATNSSAPPPFIDRTPRSSYYTQVPAISILHLYKSSTPAYASALRLDDLPTDVTHPEMASFVCSVVPRSCISKLTLKSTRRGDQCCLIYLKDSTEVSGYLTSFTFSALKNGRTPRASIATPTLYIGGWPREMKKEGIAACLLGRGCRVDHISDLHGKSGAGSRSYCFATFEGIPEAEDGLKKMDGASLWEGQALTAHWSNYGAKESFNSELSQSNPHFLEAADLATFTSRVSQLGWRATVVEYTNGDHTHLPALATEGPLLPPIDISRPQLLDTPQRDSNAPRQLSAPNAVPLGPPHPNPAHLPSSPSLKLFLGLLKPTYGVILTTLCEGFLRRSVRAAPQQSSQSETTIVMVELESQEERKVLVQSLTEMEFGGKRIIVGFTHQEVDRGLSLAPGRSSSLLVSPGARYPTPETPRALSWSSK